MPVEPSEGFKAKDIQLYSFDRPHARRRRGIISSTRAERSDEDVVEGKREHQKIDAASSTRAERCD